MPDLTIQNTTFPAKVVTGPVVYEKVFELNTATVLNAKVPVGLYLVEVSNGEIVCPCPIPYLEFSETIRSSLEFNIAVSPYLLVASDAAGGDCEDC